MISFHWHRRCVLMPLLGYKSVSSYDSRFIPSVQRIPSCPVSHDPRMIMNLIRSITSTFRNINMYFPIYNPNFSLARLRKVWGWMPMRWAAASRLPSLRRIASLKAVLSKSRRRASRSRPSGGMGMTPPSVADVRTGWTLPPNASEGMSALNGVGRRLPPKEGRGRQDLRR